MPEQPIRVAVLGFAHAMQHRLIDSLIRHPDLALAGVWAGSGEEAEEIAARYRVAVEPDPNTTLERTEVEVVMIDTAYPTRTEMICRAARQGKVILCSLPVATSLTEMDRLERVLAETGAVLLVPSELRYRLPTVRARQALQDGVVGPIYSLFCARRRRPPDRVSDSGVLLDLGPETLDYLTWCASAPVVRVYAETATLFQPALSVEDTALVHLTFADDSMGLAEIAWSLPSTYPREDDIEIEVVGQRGTVFVSPRNQKVAVYSQQQHRIVWEDWLTPASDEIVEELIRCLRHDEPPQQSVAQACQAQRLVLAAYQSAQAGQPVSLD